MLGGTLEASNEKVVVCAPRYATNYSYTPKQGNGSFIYKNNKKEVFENTGRLNQNINNGLEILFLFICKITISDFKLRFIDRYLLRFFNSK